MILYESSQGESVVISILEELKKEDRVKILKALEKLERDKLNSKGLLDINILTYPLMGLVTEAYTVIYSYIEDDDNVEDVHILHITKSNNINEGIGIALTRL